MFIILLKATIFGHVDHHQAHLQYLRALSKSKCWSSTITIVITVLILWHGIPFTLYKMLIRPICGPYQHMREGMVPRILNVNSAVRRVVTVTIWTLLTAEGALSTHRLSDLVGVTAGRNNVMMTEVHNWKSNSGILSDSQLISRSMHYGSLIIQGYS